MPRVFEKVFNSAQQQAAASPAKSSIFQAAVSTAVAWSQSRDEPGGSGPGLRLRHGLFDRLVYGKLRDAVGGQVQYAVSGGAPLGERLGHFFRGVGLTVLEGYGLTETSAAAAVNKPTRNKIGTVGQPLPGVSMRIAEDGEILIKGPNVFAGYWQNKAATAETLDDDGWLHTGDLGEPRRRGLPAGDRPEEGADRHGRRQERRAGRAGGPAARPSADQPVHGRRRRPPVHRLPGHPGPGSAGALEEAARQARDSATVADLAADPELIGRDPGRGG